MELHPNPRVLPSNAPVLPGDTSDLLSTPTGLEETLSLDTCQSYSRGNDSPACTLPHSHTAFDCEYGILRASSGNVGPSIFESRNAYLKTEGKQKSAFKSVSSLVNPPHHSAQAAIKAGHPRRRQPSSFSSQRLIYWGVEWETPRYCAYREKCRLQGSKNGKWPDRVEEAFQMAIRFFQRRGRKKYELRGKQCGGNEFISYFIERTTGAIRTRKQVSSHLQVLKGFMPENKLWMSLVADIKPEGPRNRKHDDAAREAAVVAYENLVYDDGFDIRASYPPIPNRPSAAIENLASDVRQGPTIQRISLFDMTLQDTHDKGTIYHIFTSIQSETPSAPKVLSDVSNWHEMYPALAIYLDRGQIDCPVYLFDTHLSLPDKADTSCLLGTQLSMEFHQGADFVGWHQQNGCLVDFAKIGKDLEPLDLLNSEVMGTDNCTLSNVGFKSEWWSRVLTPLIIKKEEVAKSRDPTLIREEEECANREVQGLSGMQEIWATHRASKRGPQRMAILLWRFSTAKRGERGTTSWRQVLPPFSAYDIQSPHPPSEKPPMTLDTTLEASLPFDTHQNSQPSIFSGCPTGDLSTAPLSEASSLSMTPTLESRSFPSSTSTSIPSAASSSNYPLFPSQDSSFQLQDSAYPALGGFDSQSSGYSLYEHQEVVETSHESFESQEFANDSQESYQSQEVIYHSQESLYPQAPDELYEYPYHIVEPPFTAPSSQDFTGGEIHLSYGETEDSQSTYEPPLIAPQANMVPQHQLIQHPEHFDQHDYLEQNPNDVSGGHDEVNEQADVQQLSQFHELNGLTMDYGTWEETLRLHPDLEGSLNAMDEVEKIGQQYMTAMGQAAEEPAQGEVLGEVRDDETSPATLLDYQETSSMIVRKV